MNTISRIKNELENKGFAKYKASIILESDKLTGWFMNKAQTTFAGDLSELIYDLDSLQINIDYDQQNKEVMSLKGAFENFLGRKV